MRCSASKSAPFAPAVSRISTGAINGRRWFETATLWTIRYSQALGSRTSTPVRIAVHACSNAC